MVKNSTSESVPSSPKIKVHYATEGVWQMIILDLDELLSFTKRFRVLSISWYSQ